MIEKEQWDILLQAVENGMNISDSCGLAGISRESFYNKREDEPAFALKVKQARLKNKERNILMIQQTAIKNWFAAAWWLERRYKKEFSTLQKLEHAGAVKLEQGDLRSIVAKLSPDDQQHYRELLAKILESSKSAGKTGDSPRDVGAETDLPQPAPDLPENVSPPDEMAPRTP